MNGIKNQAIEFEVCPAEIRVFFKENDNME
jgi:hypothetical protein